MNFRGWCRLCGSFDGSAELSSSCCFLVEQVLEVINRILILRAEFLINLIFIYFILFQIPAIAMAICTECNFLITEFDSLLKKARKLDRLFTGLVSDSFENLNE